MCFYKWGIPPKWMMVYNGKSYENGWYRGTTILGNLHIYKYMIHVYDICIWYPWQTPQPAQTFFLNLYHVDYPMNNDINAWIPLLTRKQSMDIWHRIPSMFLLWIFQPQSNMWALPSWVSFHHLSTKQFSIVSMDSSIVAGVGLRDCNFYCRKTSHEATSPVLFMVQFAEKTPIPTYITTVSLGISKNFVGQRVEIITFPVYAQHMPYECPWSPDYHYEITLFWT